jgi:integrase
VASPEQVSALLDAVARTRPELAAFFGCLYYAALRPEEAVALRLAALSLWLNAGGDPAQIAARAGNSVAVLLTVYSHCIHGHDDLLNPTEASGYTDRATGTQAVRYASVDFPPDPPTARRPSSAPSGRTPKQYR